MTVIHQCECIICQQSESHPDQEHHQQMNLFMSRLNEQQRRWYAAIEARKLGHGGTILMAKITGLSVADRPVERVRQAGGVRKTVEKKRPPSNSPSRK